ncbi:MAG: elongation factor P maturation arginine rhamnosyltransferase EarP [Burkholderiaceae bacterium]
MGAAPLTISLFCYPVGAVVDLLECLAAHPRPVRLLVPEGVAGAALARYFGRPLTRHGGPLARGALQAAALRWLDQRDYDDLLHACALNFVRGEDSWIRAHWAGRPFVWQPYPQDDATRRIKLDAWLDRLTADWPEPAAEATRALHRAWIGDGRIGDAWPGFARYALDEPGAARWQAFQSSLRRQPDLASQLIEFTRALASS